MTAPILDEPFVIHTFVETHGSEPHRVFHPIGTDDSWIPKSRLYGDHLQLTKHSPTNPCPTTKTPPSGTPPYTLSAVSIGF